MRSPAWSGPAKPSMAIFSARPSPIWRSMKYAAALNCSGTWNTAGPAQKTIQQRSSRRAALGGEAQRRSARDSGVGAVVGAQQRNFSAALVDAPARQQVLDVGKEAAHQLTHSAADHHDLRLQHI